MMLGDMIEMNEFNLLESRELFWLIMTCVAPILVHPAISNQEVPMTVPAVLGFKVDIILVVDLDFSNHDRLRWNLMASLTSDLELRLMLSGMSQEMTQITGIPGDLNMFSNYYLRMAGYTS